MFQAANRTATATAEMAQDMATPSCAKRIIGVFVTADSGPTCPTELFREANHQTWLVANLRQAWRPHRAGNQPRPPRLRHEAKLGPATRAVRSPGTQSA